MSVGQAESVRSVVPIPDLTVVEMALGRSEAELKAALRTVRPADVGRELSRLSAAKARRLLDAAEDRYAAAMLRSTHPSTAAQAVSHCDQARILRLLSFLPIDTQAAIIAELPRGAAYVDPKDKIDVERILSYPERSVGRLMTTKIFRAALSATASEALEQLRAQHREIEVASNCYVVDGERVVGVVALRELVIADPATRLETLMATDVVTVSPTADRADAAEIITTHNFLSLPVVEGGRLIGAVTVDDLLDSALNKLGAGLLNQGAVAGKVVAAMPYFRIPLHRVVRSRVTWLVLLFVAETATGTVLRHFEGALERWVQLAFFIPLLIGTGGNAGSQTVSTVIRALALGEIRMKDVLRVALKEITAGLILGILLGAIAFGRARLWGCNNSIAACVGLTIVVVCTWANTVGAVIPIAAQRLRIDPTVISGPLITTLVDASGLFLYLTIAMAILS